MVVQGLAVKLAGADQFNSEDLKIIIKPRHSQYVSAHSSINDNPGEEPAAARSEGEMATIETGVNVIGVGQLANMGSMASVN